MTPRRDLDEAAQSACRWLNGLAASGQDLRRNAHKKVAAEASEFAYEPSMGEAADVFIALIGAVIHLGYTPDDLAVAVEAKVARNRQRTWRLQSDGTFQHVEETAHA